MAYCNFCGEFNTDDSDFCKRCGKRINNIGYDHSNNNYSSMRNNVYVGNIRRCPVCNEIVPNMATVCVTCGFQFNNTLINPTLERFSNKIQSFDMQIPAEKNDIYYIKRKSKDNKQSGIMIVLLTIFSFLTLFSMFWFVLVVIIYIILLFKQPTNDKTPILTRSEIEKSNFIDNFVFPNDSETIIELLQFIKNKIKITAGLKADKDSLYWSNLWLNKAEQLYSKSGVSLGNNAIVEQLYQDIKSLNLNYLKNYNKYLLRQRPFVLVKFLSGLAFSFRLIFLVFSSIG